MRQFFLDLTRNIHRMLNPPRHIRVVVLGHSIDDCLRQLEDEAGLPFGDLSLRGDPMEVATFAFGHRGLQHIVVSKTSEGWGASNAKDGYIAGSVAVFESSILEDKTCSGRLHISRNCRGVYKDNVCTTCGNESR